MNYLTHFILYCFLVFLFYIQAHTYLTYYSPKYRNLKYNKKTYVVANIVKSIILLLMSPLCVYILISFMNDPDEKTYIIAFITTCIYSSTDMISLIFERGKKTSTVYHHILVQLASFTAIYCGPFNTLTDIIIIYGSFSAFAYFVNLYLAIRFLIDDKNIVEPQILATYAFLVYILCCVANWSIQLVYIVSFLTSAQYLYFALLTFFNYVVINDDIVLMKFLYKNSLLKTSALLSCISRSSSKKN